MKPYELYNLIYSKESKQAGDDVDYFICKKAKCLYLAFRGSESLNDWMHNFNFPVKMYKHQENTFFVHQGFAAAYLSANDVIMKEFLDACNNNPTYTPVIIGHSLGGALATLAAEDYFYRTKKQVKLVTFGCPKVLWGCKSKKYFLECMSSVEQYEVNNDLVPKVPATYTNLKSIPIGESYNFFKMIKNANYYHTSYGLSELY